MPLYRRLPKFVSGPRGAGYWLHHRLKLKLLHVNKLNRVPDGSEVDWDIVAKARGTQLGRLRKGRDYKVVGPSISVWRNKGESHLVTRNLTVKAHAFTKRAAREIIANGGKCILLQRKTRDKIVGEYNPDIAGMDKIPRRVVYKGAVPKPMREGYIRRRMKRLERLRKKRVSAAHPVKPA